VEDLATLGAGGGGLQPGPDAGHPGDRLRRRAAGSSTRRGRSRGPPAWVKDWQARPMDRFCSGLLGGGQPTNGSRMTGRSYHRRRVAGRATSTGRNPRIPAEWRRTNMLTSPELTPSKPRSRPCRGSSSPSCSCLPD
jgi:hypothetical protein